jgi:hypothetical protein
MPPLTVPAHFDGSRIQLDRPVELKKNTRLLVTVVSDEEEEFRRDCFQLARQGLAALYSDDEPDYSDAPLIEINPDYAGD